MSLLIWFLCFSNAGWFQFMLSHFIGLNKDFKRMIGEHAEFGALSFKDVRSASDGTRKVNKWSNNKYFESLVVLSQRSFWGLIHNSAGCCRFCSRWMMGL